MIRLCDIVCTYTLWHLQISLTLRDIVTRPYFFLILEGTQAKKNWDELKELTVIIWATFVSINYADTCVYLMKLSIWSQEGSYNKGYKFICYFVWLWNTIIYFIKQKEPFWSKKW